MNNATVHELHTKFPDSVITINTFESKSIQQQAKWVASMDIIIGVHGAAMTNIAFICPNTIVLELFPRNYYYRDFYQPLITQSGGIALEWYPGNSPIADSKQHSRSFHGRVRWRSLDITPAVDEIINLVSNAVENNRQYHHD